jgi:hypothetical protein
VQQSAFLSQTCCSHHFDLIFGSKNFAFCKSFRNRSDQMGFWLLLPALSPLVELDLVSFSCFVGAAGATTVLSQSSCESQEVLGISPRR